MVEKACRVRAPCCHTPRAVRSMERRKGPFSRNSAEFPLGPLFVAHHLHSDARSCGVDGGCIELRAA